MFWKSLQESRVALAGNYWHYDFITEQIGGGGELCWGGGVKSCLMNHQELLEKSKKNIFVLGTPVR